MFAQPRNRPRPKRMPPSSPRALPREASHSVSLMDGEGWLRSILIRTGAKPGTLSGFSFAAAAPKPAASASATGDGPSYLLPILREPALMPEESEEYVPPEVEKEEVEEADAFHKIRAKLFHQKDGEGRLGPPWKQRRGEEEALKGSSRTGQSGWCTRSRCRRAACSC